MLRIAQSEGIAGIIAPCTDVAVETAAYVSSTLGLQGVPPASAELLTRKLAFREFLRSQNLPHPEYVPVGRSDVVANSFSDGRRWVIKPNRSSGSKGVRIVSTMRELLTFRDEAARLSLDGRAILEQFIPGSQHTCEGFLSAGRMAFSLVTDRETTKPPHTATAGHYVPSSLTQSAQQAVHRQIATVFAKLGIKDGPLDCDFVASQDTCTIIEIVRGLAATRCRRWFARPVASILLKPRFNPPVAISRMFRSREFRASAVLILGVERSGALRFDPGAADILRKEEWVGNLQLDIEPLAPVRSFTSGRDRVGEALILAGSRSELDLRAHELKRRLGLAVEASA